MSTSKIVLITGANKGIGFEIAKQLASQYKGYHILMGSRDVERGVKAAETLQKDGLSAEFLAIDVADDKSIEAAAQTVKSKFGRLDVLINNAGIGLDSFTGEPSNRAIFEQTFAVNLFGAASTTEAFVPLLEKSTAARLVFVSSDLGSLKFLADPEGRHNYVAAPAYRCSKAAMNMLALGYAHRFRAKGWKVNIHNPGYTATDLNGHSGPGTVEDGAKGAVRLAVLADDGETERLARRRARCHGSLASINQHLSTHRVFDLLTYAESWLSTPKFKISLGLDVRGKLGAAN